MTSDKALSLSEKHHLQTHVERLGQRGKFWFGIGHAVVSVVQSQVPTHGRQYVLSRDDALQRRLDSGPLESHGRTNIWETTGLGLDNNSFYEYLGKVPLLLCGDAAKIYKLLSWIAVIAIDFVISNNDGQNAKTTFYKNYFEMI